MQPKTTLLFLFLLLPKITAAQQILPPEVRPARPVEEPAAQDQENPPPDTPVTPPVAPVAPPEEKVDAPIEPAEKPPSPQKKTKPAETKPATDPETGSPTPGTKVDREPMVPGLNAASLLPIGVPSFDVRMPEFDEDILVSRMKVRELTRIDEDQLDLRDMDLERYLPDGSIDYIISIGRGFYAMSTGRLISSAPTRLRGKAIDLHGQGCVYSRDNDVVKILGKVTSYIYLEEGQLDKPEPKAPPAENPPTSRSPAPQSPGP